MAHSTPEFNLLCNYWDDDANYTVVPAVIELLPCQLRAPIHTPAAQGFGVANGVYMWSILVPAGTNIRDYSQNWEGGIIEVPAGSGRAYSVIHVDDVAKGFPNEYRIVFVRKFFAENLYWPSPMP